MCAEKTKLDAINRNTDYDNNDDDDDKHDGYNSTVKLSSSIDIVTKLSANLVRQLLADVDILFISQPLTIT